MGKKEKRKRKEKKRRERKPKMEKRGEKQERTKENKKRKNEEKRKRRKITKEGLTPIHANPKREKVCFSSFLLLQLLLLYNHHFHFIIYIITIICISLPFSLFFHCKNQKMQSRKRELKSMHKSMQKTVQV